MLGFALIVVLVSLFVLNERIRKTGDSGDAMIATVNGEPVQTGEFMLLVSRFRSKTYQYFQQRYAATATSQFWSTRFGDEMPSEYIKNLALQEAVRIKAQQLWAKQYGVIEDAGYSAFLEKLQQENDRRKQSAAAGLPIYGPKQYAADGYYDYLLSNMVIKLKEKLQAGELAPTEQQLHNYALLHSNKMYQKDEDAFPDWMEEAYQKKLDELVKQAKVEVRQNTYKRIKVM